MITSDTAPWIGSQSFSRQPWMIRVKWLIYYYCKKLAMLMIWVLAPCPTFRTFKCSWKQMQLWPLTSIMLWLIQCHHTVSPGKKKTLAVNIHSLNSITPNRNLKSWCHCHQIMKKATVTRIINNCEVVVTGEAGKQRTTRKAKQRNKLF